MIDDTDYYYQLDVICCRFATYKK